MEKINLTFDSLIIWYNSVTVSSWNCLLSAGFQKINKPAAGFIKCLKMWDLKKYTKI